MKRGITTGTVLCVVLVIACSPQPATRTGPIPELNEIFDFDVLEIENDAGQRVELDVYVAIDFEQQRRGLMFVRDMPERTGMLFIYEDEAVKSMWMKNTYIPLDIVFARSDGTVASVNRYTVPLTLTSQASKEPVRYVLELNAGTTRRLGIGEGSRLLVDEALLATARQRWNQPGS